MGETTISWTQRPGTVGRSWNPTQGCAMISEGCRNCYAQRMAARFAEHGWSKGLINRLGKWNGEARLAEHKLAEPLGWRKPATVFVNSMSDLYYDGFSDEWIAAVFGVMAACPQHTFITLTKRARRRRQWHEWMMARVQGPVRFCTDAADRHGARVYERGDAPSSPHAWPLPNVWEGVSAENQEAADERIEDLLASPAAVRLVSLEPLIGPIDLCRVPGALRKATSVLGALTGTGWHSTGLDWVIAGCESGFGARACNIEWLRSLREQCAGWAPFFLKQAMADEFGHGVEVTDGRMKPVPLTTGPGSTRKLRGRRSLIELPYLDGVQHAAFPEAA